jgi:hypothetical protein
MNAGIHDNILAETMQVNLETAMSRLCGEFWTGLPVASAQVFVGSCFLGNLHLTNSGADRWVHVFDCVSADGVVPEDGIWPKLRIPLKEGGMVHVSGPIAVSRGVFLISSGSPVHTEQDESLEGLHIYGQVFSAVSAYRR